MKRALFLALFASMATPLVAEPPKNPGCILGEVSPKAGDWMAELTANPRDPENQTQQDLADEVVMAAMRCTVRNGWSDSDMGNAMVYASASAWNTRSLRRLQAAGFDATTLAYAEDHPDFAAFYTKVEGLASLDKGRAAADALLASMGAGPLTDEQRPHAQDVLLSAAFFEYAKQQFFAQAQ